MSPLCFESVITALEFRRHGLPKCSFRFVDFRHRFKHRKQVQVSVWQLQNARLRYIKEAFGP